MFRQESQVWVRSMQTLTKPLVAFSADGVNPETFNKKSLFRPSSEIDPPVPRKSLRKTILRSKEKQR